MNLIIVIPKKLYGKKNENVSFKHNIHFLTKCVWQQ